MATHKRVSPAKRLALFTIGFVLLSCTATSLRAQSFQFSLEDVSSIYVENPFDTVPKEPIDKIKLGPHHYVPHFLDTDWSRVQVVQEFLGEGELRFTFRYPNTERFAFDEERDGVFFVARTRDLDIPGLEIEVASVDDLAERQRVNSLRETWRQTVVASINAGDAVAQARGGSINVPLPIKLPGFMERILGEGEASNINISGRESITFSGESRRVSPFIGVEGQQRQSLFPSLDLQQELDVRLQGQIGEKINVQVDHSSAAITDANRIRLNFVGFDDDVIQLIEMGNTSLSLPGSELVNFSTSSQGLFGIKLLAQVGPMDMTVIASKEESELSRASFNSRGGSIGETERRIIRDIDFVQDTFFFLDHPTNPGAFIPPSVTDVVLWESAPPSEVAANPEITYREAKAFVDVPGDGSDIEAVRQQVDNQLAITAAFQQAKFRELFENVDYTFITDAENDTIILGVELLRPIADSKILAAKYTNINGDQVGFLNTPNGAPRDTLLLELIKPRAARPTDTSFGYTWPYMMRHIYNLGLSNIDVATLELEILDNSNRLDSSIPDGASVPWIRVFGLDRTGASGQGDPDNRVDITNVIDAERGLLIFPIFTPFNPPDDSVTVWTDSLFAFTGPLYQNIRQPRIYTDFLTRPEDFQRFRIEVSGASTASTFRIDAFNIQENSEVVRLDGRPLQRGQDYTINYDTGEVELQGEVLNQLSPSSNITIDYEFEPFGAGGGSSLVGFNSVLNLSEHSRIGTTWLYESKSSSTGRPRLGEEPTRAVVGDLNANLQFNPDFLTDVANWLPLVDTDAESQLTISSEVALSIPDPNTTGEVYIDDFEGVEDSDIITLVRRGWWQASPPTRADSIGFTVLDAADREPIRWYNIEPRIGVTRRDLNPDLDERESTVVTSLDLEVDSVTTDTTRWTGVVGGFRGGGLDLSQGQFIEIWVNDFKPDSLTRGGVLNIDLGFIDEDFYRPDENDWNNEDANGDGFTAITEDTGLDGVFDGNPADDPDDDYIPNRIDGIFSQINGTEGNLLLDSEDLDGSGGLDQINAYFTFQVDLTSPAVVDVRKEFPNSPRFNEENHKDDSWRLYRINLAEGRAVAKDGTPFLEQITHVRVWFDHIGEVMDPVARRLQLVGFKIVGNRWEEDGVRDALNDSLIGDFTGTGTTIGLGVIGTKTDPTEYIPPINPREQNGIFDREQSLLVTYENLRPAEGLRIRKRFAGQGLDWRTYRDLNFFVHTSQINPSVEYFFQVAFDSLNYYEVRVPLTTENFPDQNWAGVFISLTDITDLKFLPADSVVTSTIRDLRDPTKTYGIRMVGTPNLFTVRFLYAGLRNNDSVEITGDLWLNDIFLGNRRRDIDFAQRAAASLNIANVINLSANWRRTGPDFRGLRQARGAGTDSRALALNARTNLVHFLPLFGFNIPVSGTFNRNTLLPKFTPNSDTEISNPALRDSLKTQNESRSISVSITKSGSKNPFVRYTLDKMRTNFSASQTRAQSPASRDSSLSLSGTMDYQLSFGGRNRLRLFKNTHFRYLPNSFSFRVNATRRTGRRFRNVGGVFLPDPFRFDAAIMSDGSITYVPFQSLTSSFRMNMQRDVRLPGPEWLGVDIGREIGRSQSLQVNYKPPPIWLLKSFRPDLNVTSGYGEDSSPNVRRVGDPNTTRNASATRDANLKMVFDVGKGFRKLFGGLGLSDGEEPAPPGSRPQPPRAPGGDPAAQDPPPPETPPAGGEAPADTTQADQPAKPSVDPLIAIRKLGGILSNIRRVNVSVRQQLRSVYTRIPDRPGLAYRFGLTDKAGVRFDDGREAPAERITRTIAFTADSGVLITNDIDVAARFTTSRPKTTFQSNVSETLARTWPDLNVSWAGLETRGPFRGLFKSATLTTGWQQTLREQRQRGELQSASTTRRITPALSFTWKNDISSTLSVSHARNTSESRGSRTENSTLSVSYDMRYAFQPGTTRIPLPFLNRLDLKSRLDTNVNVSWTKTDGQRFNAASPFPIALPGNTSLRVSPRATYNFSRTLNGSVFIDFARRFSDASGQTTTTIAVGISAILTF